MVFFEALIALFSIDIGFFIDIIMGNLLWVFGFYAMIHYFFGGKNVFFWLAFFSSLLWMILDMGVLVGLTFTAATFLMLYYLTKIALLRFAEDVPGLKNYLVLLSTLQAYALFLVFVFFLK